MHVDTYPSSFYASTRKKRGEKFDQFEMCLGEMCVMGEPTDFTQCTTEWIDKVNRGGLFPLNDESFRFFGTVEGVVRTVLPRVVVSCRFYS